MTHIKASEALLLDYFANSALQSILRAEGLKAYDIYTDPNNRNSDIASAAYAMGSAMLLERTRYILEFILDDNREYENIQEYILKNFDKAELYRLRDWINEQYLNLF